MYKRQIFDREGSTHSLFSKLWEKRIGAISYRKNVKDRWPVSEFVETEVPNPAGGSSRMKLAFRQTKLSSKDASMPVLADLRVKRRTTPRKVPIASLPENERPGQLLPLGKMLTDTIKMIAYRAETALVALLRPHLAKEDEARAMIRELFVSSADLVPDETANTLNLRCLRILYILSGTL